MIECKRHNASFMRPDTCIERQKVIAAGNKVASQPGKQQNGHEAWKYNQYLEMCGGCETGLELYEKHMEGELKFMPDMKLCSICKKLLPADTDHFDVANRASDGLTNACKVCRAPAAQKEAPPPPKPRAVPVDPAPKESIPKPAPATIQEALPVETAVCRGECGRELPLTPENFQRDAGYSSGFDSHCKDCRNAKRRAARRIKAGKVELPVVPEGCFFLDLREEPELLERIRGWAAKDRRTAEGQILWHLEKEVLPGELEESA